MISYYYCDVCNAASSYVGRILQLDKIIRNRLPDIDAKYPFSL